MTGPGVGGPVEMSLAEQDPRSGSWAPGDSEETGGQDSTPGQLVPLLDPDSPYAAAKPQDAGNGYVKVQMTGHPIARKDGRVLLHRVVLFDFTEGKDQPCALCGLDGLNWFAPPEDKAHHLTVDHVNSNKLDDRVTNLRATHKWCNENRHGVDRLKIPWTFFAAIPVEDRKRCWDHRLSCPTPNAYAYQRRARGETPAEPLERPAPATPTKPAATERPNPLPIRRGFVRWEDLFG